MTTATEEAKTMLEPNVRLAQIEEPFDPTEIKWRVTHTSRDGSRGAVIAFADPRAYTDRLNKVVTPCGWTRSYDVTTMSSVTRMKKDKLIQTGKVLVTCALTIHGLGSHTGSGEEWADEENAMTSAEAQAFKRACSCFGLGRYLYNFVEMWVPLNEYRQPLHYPELPKWALPRAITELQRDRAARSIAAQPGPIDQAVTSNIEDFRCLLGDSIYGEILWRIAHTDRANGIPNAQLQQDVVAAMERAGRGIQRAGLLAEEVGEGQFIAVMDSLRIVSMTAIPRLEDLKRLVAELENVAARLAA